MKKNKNPLPESVMEELAALDEGGLQKAVADANEAVAKAIKERNDNDNYKSAKIVLGDFNAGLRDVKQYQNAKIAVALLRLRELRGEVSDNE